MTLVSANIRFVPIFEWVHWREGVKRQWGNGKHGFSPLLTLRFQHVKNETNVIIYYYLIPCRLSIDPYLYDLVFCLTLNGLNVHYSLQYCDLRSCLLQFSSYLFTVEYVYSAARHVTRREVREVEFRIVIRRIFGIGETRHRRNVNNYRQNYDIVLVLHCISTNSKHCLIDICVKFCFAPIRLEL